MNSSFAVLRQFVQDKTPIEKCDLCSKRLSEEHPHLMEPLHRQLLCSCDACAILFSDRSDARYKRIPEKVRFLADFGLTDPQWENLRLPISMAFFFFSTPEQKIVALYPGPAGATESLLPLDAWNDIEERNPVLRTMQYDVEALLVNRVSSNHQYFLVPIDQCFKLVGLIRAHWRGFSGGAEVWQKIDEYFRDLRERAVEVENA